MAARSRALHDAVHAALAAGAQPADLVDVVARVRAEGASSPGQLPLFRGPAGEEQDSKL